MPEQTARQYKATIAIPLYKSARFIDTIIANIEAVSLPEVEVLISDRHLYDNTIDRLAQHYKNDTRVRLLKQTDHLDWVTHINLLLREAKGDYWRFLPHDDQSPPLSLEALIAALDANKQAILAYGPTKAINEKGDHLEKRDRLNPHPNEAFQAWSLDLILKMFWTGYFDGAFKGLVRRERILDNQLYISSTKGQIFPERCWLFALCLLGEFCFVPEATFIKCFYKGSTHSTWPITGENFLSAAQTMSDYAKALFHNEQACQYAQKDIWHNAKRMANWHDNKQGIQPQYEPYPETNADLIREQYVRSTDFR